MLANKQLNQLVSSSPEHMTLTNQKLPSKTKGTVQQNSKLLRKLSPEDLMTSNSAASLSSARTPQKRVRLRDYLFIAQTSSAMNRSFKKTAKYIPTQNSQNFQKTVGKISNKYQISNQELHKIVRKEILNECVQITKNLYSKMEMLKQQNDVPVGDEELLLLYDIQKVLVDKIKPAMMEMNDVYYQHQQKLAQQMLFLGRSLIGASQTQQKYRQVDAKHQHSICSLSVLTDKN